MLYLVRYKDGFIIGADGPSPGAAADKAGAATGRAFEDIDAITERASTFVCFDVTRGWLSPKDSERAGGELVDANTGDIVGKTAPIESPDGVELADLKALDVVAEPPVNDQ